MKRIHIVGTGPRTGTTLMCEALIACFDIDQHTDHEDRVFTRLPAEGKIFLTKCVKDILAVKPLLIVNPDLYVICMMRDPRDAIVSRHGVDPDKYWAGLRYWKTYLPHWRQLHGHPRFTTVKYEELVTDHAAVQQRLVERLPFLTAKAPFSRYGELSKPSQKSLRALRGVRPITPDSVGRWRRHLPRIAGQLRLHGSITRDLIEFGYEKDATWIDVLDGIEPDMTGSHWPEFFTRIGILRRKRRVYQAAVKTLILRKLREALRIRPTDRQAA